MSTVVPNYAVHNLGALHRAPRRTVEYACGALSRAPCIHARLRGLATKSGEKCGLTKLARIRFATGHEGIRGCLNSADSSVNGEYRHDRDKPPPYADNSSAAFPAFRE